MKRLLTALAIVALTAGYSFGFAVADFDQAQLQGDGGFSAPAGFIGGSAQGQIGGGFAAAEPGDNATVDYEQNQIAGGVESWDGISGTAWEGSQTQISSGDTGTGGGFFASGVVQGQVGGSAGINNTVGTASVAGSAYLGGGAVGAIALGDAEGFAANSQSYESGYVQVNQGPQSYIAQTGEQSVYQASGVAAAGNGAGIAGTGVAQAGGTAAVNDGNAGAMAGAGSAAGDASAFAASGGNAVAAGFAVGTQEHSYTQEAVSGDGTNYQGQTGTVTTTVTAFAID